MKCIYAAVLLTMLNPPLAALAAGPHDAVLAALEAAARSADRGFAGFSGESGKALFMADHAGGKPGTPSCTTCHTKSLSRSGQTRAGKAIDPMAVSANPKRFTDLQKVEKWFGRNCNAVLGRDCTPQEKGNIAVWLIAP